MICLRCLADVARPDEMTDLAMHPGELEPTPQNRVGLGNSPMSRLGEVVVGGYDLMDAGLGYDNLVVLPDAVVAVGVRQ